MKKLIALGAAALALGLPGTAVASGHSTAKANAAKACKTERAADPAAFKAKYGTNANGHNAFGKCVSQQRKAAKAERKAARAQRRAAKHAEHADREKRHGDDCDGKDHKDHEDTDGDD
jgi:hypothetical protein